jgi:hypothetical protein
VHQPYYFTTKTDYVQRKAANRSQDKNEHQAQPAAASFPLAAAFPVGFEGGAFAGAPALAAAGAAALANLSMGAGPLVVPKKEADRIHLIAKALMMGNLINSETQTFKVFAFYSPIFYSPILTISVIHVCIREQKWLTREQNGQGWGGPRWYVRDDGREE